MPGCAAGTSLRTSAAARSSRARKPWGASSISSPFAGGRTSTGARARGNQLERTITGSTTHRSRRARTGDTRARMPAPVRTPRSATSYASATWSTSSATDHFPGAAGRCHRSSGIAATTSVNDAIAASCSRSARAQARDGSGDDVCSMRQGGLDVAALAARAGGAPAYRSSSCDANGAHAATEVPEPSSGWL